MSFDLHLESSCNGFKMMKILYESNCMHMKLCLDCWKQMAETKRKCIKCGVTITHLIRVHNHGTKKDYVASLEFPVSDSCHFWLSISQEKYKNKPWLLEDEAGQSKYYGLLECAQSATYYLLMLQGKEFHAIPIGLWYV
ncbi:hypothetical protein GIB67_018028 [Kingdonia uniflora]|uniref:Transcription initiation factor IIF subunit alpha n=1 Tax=Kingdonia uniflora TaxID=39325 RepID=A0A7J7NX29_9MAGN|nr:hypothetical protein GIB67_018028 [Kingdonia uniflora]